VNNNPNRWVSNKNSARPVGSIYSDKLSELLDAQMMAMSPSFFSVVFLGWLFLVRHGRQTYRVIRWSFLAAFWCRGEARFTFLWTHPMRSGTRAFRGQTPPSNGRSVMG
jgi:hypothetical protein